jgi:serine/threonine-protein phosphatase PGAM5
VRRIPLLVLAFGALLGALPAAAPAVLPGGDGPVRTVYLVRHGEYDHADTRDPDVGRGLVALGRQQARLLAARLDAAPVRFTSIQASTMTRARETAEIVAARFEELPLTLHRDLRECTPTTRRADIMAELEPGEAAACEANLAAAWSRIFVPAPGPGDAHDIVVCHGNVIRWFVCRVLQVDPAAWLGMSIANASLTVVQIRADGSTKLLAFADAGHIPWEMTTYPGITAPQ